MFEENLIQKYNIPGPRYTSYPTVPYWEENSVDANIWKKSFRKSFIESNQKEGISLYVHLPFCESLCTFCACHKRITKQHSVEKTYINYLIKEWSLYLQELPEKPIIKEIHLGGGTPTFFSSENLKHLLESIFEGSILHNEKEFSFEGHPSHTSYGQLKTLYDLGFRRVSFGVQDYDKKVQKAINRIQSFEAVEQVTNWSREIGYESISHDLIFGLPFQTVESIENTIDFTKTLQPDRIAFYSYAHVPWIKGNGQRGFDENDLPTASLKREMYEFGKNQLETIGYHEIGMDHFSLPSDSLFQSMKNKKIHRNFMGYTSSKTQLMIGLGSSSISDSWYAFAQNEKTIEEYYKRLDANELPVFRGHLLTEEDLIIRKHILNLMCHLETSWQGNSLIVKYFDNIKIRLKEMIKDELIILSENSIIVTEKGRPFVRNICMCLDMRMLNKQPETRIFSMTV